MPIKLSQEQIKAMAFIKEQYLKINGILESVYNAAKEAKCESFCSSVFFSETNTFLPDGETIDIDPENGSVGFDNNVSIFGENDRIVKQLVVVMSDYPDDGMISLFEGAANEAKILQIMAGK